MKASINVTELSERKNLFGIKETTSQTITSTTSIDIASSYQNNQRAEKVRLEAERKKAETITILRQHALFR
jgi:hypothetical protein